MRAALFDVFGTVVDWRSGVGRDVGVFFRSHAIRGIDPVAFADAWRERYAPAMEEVRAGRRPFVPLDRLHSKTFKRRWPGSGLPHRIFRKPSCASSTAPGTGSIPGRMP
jgi:2-haloacid dehalogenase